MEFNFNEVTNLLLEGRVEDARKKYPNISEEDFEFLVSIDPSGNQKYLSWLCKMVNSVLEMRKGTFPGSGEVILFDTLWEAQPVTESITFFHENQQLFEKKDINQYKTFTEFYEQQQKVKSQKQEKEALKKAKKEAIRIANTDEHLIVIPTSYEASCTYGAGTKWCTTSKDSDEYYNNHTSSGTLIYVLRKGIPNDNRFYKIAFFLRHTGILEIYDAPDKSVNKDILIEYIGEEEWDTIRGYIIDYLEYVGSDGVENFLTQEEIKSYLDSGNINILKLSNSKLLQYFKGDTDYETIHNIYNYVVEKGLDVNGVRYSLITQNLTWAEANKIYRDFNINPFNMLYQMSNTLHHSDNTVKVFLRRLGEDGNFDYILRLIEHSKFGNLTNFLNFYPKPTLNNFFLDMSNQKKELLFYYLMDGGQDLTDYFNSVTIVGVLGDKFAEYIKQDTLRLEEFFNERSDFVWKLKRNFKSMVKFGFTPEDIEFLIEEGVIYIESVDLKNLSILFPNRIKTGIRWFFDEVRMDKWCIDMSDFSLTLGELTEVLGSRTFEFIEQELRKLGPSIDNQYDFRENDDITSFINENFTSMELYETFISPNDDFESFLKYSEKYGLEPTLPQKIVLVNEVGGESEYITKLEEEIIDYITDVEKVGDDYILTTDGWLDFEGWMYDGGDCCKDTFNYFFNEDTEEHFYIYNTIYDWMDNVWDTVMDTNKVEHVRNYVKEHHLDDEVLDVDGEEVKLTLEYIENLSDSDLGYVIDTNEDIFDELHRDLGEAYHWSYNGAYDDEVTNDFISEIESIIESKDKPQWDVITKTRYDNTEYRKEVLRFKIGNFWDILLDSAKSHIYEDAEIDDLDYNDYVSLVGQLMGWGELESIHIRIPDYPDYTKIKEQFEDIIHSYI